MPTSPASPAAISPPPTVSLGTRCWRLLRLGGHVGQGLLRILLCFPRYSLAQRQGYQQAFSRKLLVILGVRLEVLGVPPPVLFPANTLVVANHVSWLDIVAINSTTITRFVAKSEIRDWPLIGLLATRAGTLYIERSSRRDAARINMTMAKALKAGDCIGLFPEGTTSDGRALLPFKSSLFDAAVKAKAQVWPVTLRFKNADGSISDTAPYVGETHLLQSVWQLVSARGQAVEVFYGAPVSSEGHTRFSLAERVAIEVAAPLNLTSETLGRVVETPADPPA